MVLHTFAPAAIPIIGACAMTLAAVILFVTRAGKLPPNFSERTRFKYLATIFAYMVTAVFYLCVALGNHHFGHNLINGHWSPTGMWLAFGLGSTALAYAFGLAFSQNETYAWVYTFFQGVISALIYTGSRNIDHTHVPLAMSILAAAFWAFQTYYFLRWCTPSEEWQVSHGGSLYFITRLIIQIIFAVFWIFFIVDVTYLNKFNDHEQNPWIAYLIANFFLYFVGGLLANLYFNPDVMPPIGIWADVSDVTTGLMTGQSAVLRQELAPNPAAETSSGSVPSTAGSTSEFHWTA